MRRRPGPLSCRPSVSLPPGADYLPNIQILAGKASPTLWVPWSVSESESPSTGLTFTFYFLGCGTFSTQDPEHAQQIKVRSASTQSHVLQAALVVSRANWSPGAACRSSQPRGLADTWFSVYLSKQPRTPRWPINGSVLRTESAPFFSSYTIRRNTQNKHKLWEKKTQLCFLSNSIMILSYLERLGMKFCISKTITRMI